MLEKQEGPLSTTRAYESSSGDTWDLVRDDATDEMRVRHSPNLASGGQSSELALADFLRIEPHSPQHQAVVALLALETSGERHGVVGYVHEPKERGGPYIAVVLRPGGEPAVTIHKSHAEAEREIARAIADLRQTSLYRLRGDEIPKRT